MNNTTNTTNNNNNSKPNIEYHKNMVSIKKRKETNYIVVHCAATQCKNEYDWKSIDQMHRQRGWLCIGYHFVIKADGTIQNGRDVDTIGSHVKGYNHESVGICLIGGVNSQGKPTDNFTDEQMESLEELIKWLKSDDMYPNAAVQGHRDFPKVAKACPCFDVIPWWYFLSTSDNFYMVKKGETAWGIAKLFDISLNTLQGLNPKLDLNKLQVGEQLCIKPAKKTNF